MRKTAAIGAAALAALAAAASARAHHSGSMYVTTPVWIAGTVVRFDDVNPHTITLLEQRSEDGQVRRWAVEGPGQSQLERMGLGTLAPQVGDTLEFCAFPYRSPAELSRMFPEADFSARRASPDTDGPAPQFLAGHVMVMPDGEMRVWEPHGLISECIRSSDDRIQSWLDFLASDQRALRAWCEQQAYTHVQSTESLRALVARIDGAMNAPCE